MILSISHIYTNNVPNIDMSLQRPSHSIDFETNADDIYLTRHPHGFIEDSASPLAFLDQIM